MDGGKGRKSASVQLAGRLLPRWSSCTAAQRQHLDRPSSMCKRTATHPIDVQSQGPQTDSNARSSNYGRWLVDTQRKEKRGGVVQLPQL